MIGIIGGTGTIGRHLVAELQHRNIPLTCLVRDLAQTVIAATQTTRLVEADLEKPETLKAGLEGCHALFLLTGPHPRLSAQQLPVLETARQLGIGHIVKLSAGYPVVSETSASQIGREHWRVEEALKDSGLDWTMLRPGFFMQNFLPMASIIRSHQAVALPVPGHMTVCMIDVQDIAAVAALVLETGDHKGEVISLAGEGYMMTDFPLLLSHLSGTSVSYERVSFEDASAGMKAGGLPDWMIAQQIEVLRLMAAGAFSVGQDRSATITGKPRRSLSDFTRTHLEHFRAD